MNKRFQIHYISNNSGNLYPKGIKAYNQNSCAAGSLARKYNHCKNSGTSDVLECTLNPSCCSGKEEPIVVYSVVGGMFQNSQGVYQAFVTEEKNGQWRLPVTNVSFVNGSLQPGYYNVVTSIAASGYGYAVAGGFYYDINGFDHAFVINQTPNGWDTNATPLSFPNPSPTTPYSYVNSVSSSSPGYAVAGGQYNDDTNHNTAFVINQTPNGWDTKATPLSFPNPNPTNPYSYVNSVSSSSPGYAVAGGYYYDDTNHNTAFVINQTPNGWDTNATPISFPNPSPTNPLSYVTSVSSSNPGYAVAGGNYYDDTYKFQAFVISQTPNGWDINATPISFPNPSPTDPYSYVSSVSSSQPGYAVAAGYYRDSNNNIQSFVIHQVNGIWQQPAIAVTHSFSDFFYDYDVQVSSIVTKKK